MHQAVRTGLSRVINTKINKALARVEKFPLRKLQQKIRGNFTKNALH